jgi:hypothetical protein
MGTAAVGILAVHVVVVDGLKLDRSMRGREMVSDDDISG